MRHARAPALDGLEPLLTELRALPGLTEKSRGAFYRKSRAFLHFHEDPSGTYADVKLAGADFARLRAGTAQEQEALVTLVARALEAARR